MPNWTTNVITFEGDEKEISSLKEFIHFKDEKEESFFDFGKVIPMPESLNMTSGGPEDTSIRVYMSSINPMTDIPYEKVASQEFGVLLEKVKKATYFFEPKNYFLPLEEAKKTIPSNNTLEEYQELGKKYIENLLQYGATSWYGWCNKNWGTKWNASNTRYTDEITLLFYTAWCAPLPVVKKLSEMYPEITIHHSFADEDFGSGVGEVDFKGGEVVAEEIPEPFSSEAIEMAAEVLETTPEEYGYRLVDGKYVYADEEDEE